MWLQFHLTLSFFPTFTKAARFNVMNFEIFHLLSFVVCSASFNSIYCTNTNICVSKIEIRCFICTEWHFDIKSCQKHATYTCIALKTSRNAENKDLHFVKLKRNGDWKSTYVYIHEWNIQELKSNRNLLNETEKSSESLNYSEQFSLASWFAL